MAEKGLKRRWALVVGSQELCSWNPGADPYFVPEERANFLLHTSEAMLREWMAKLLCLQAARGCAVYTMSFRFLRLEPNDLEWAVYVDKSEIRQAVQALRLKAFFVDSLARFAFCDLVLEGSGFLGRALLARFARRTPSPTPPHGQGQSQKS